MDYVLLQTSLDRILAQLMAAESGIAAIDVALPSPANTISNLALAQEIVRANEFCQSSAETGEFLSQLLDQLREFQGGPCGPVPSVPCNKQGVYF